MKIESAKWLQVIERVRLKLKVIKYNRYNQLTSTSSDLGG